MTKKFNITVSKEENIYISKNLKIGTSSQGKTVKQAIKNLKEATKLYLEEFPVKK